MIFIELAMQGVGLFLNTTKISLKPGFNLITGANESGKTTIYDCLFSFLHNGRHPNFQRLINWDKPQASRAALTFKSRDGETYKAVQDYLKGQVAVFKFNPSPEKFDFMDKGETWLKEFLHSESGGLESEIEKIFGLQCNALLSVASSSHKGSTNVSPVSAGNGKEDAHFKEKRLKELKEMLKKAEELSQLEYQMDEIQNKIRDLGKKIEDFNTIEERLGTISEELKQLKNFADISANVPELISAHEKREQERVDALRRFEDDKLIQEEELAKIPSKPIYQNKTFVIGGGAAIISNVVIFSINLPAMVKPLYPVVFLSGLGMLGYALFKEIQLNTARGEKEEKIKAMNTEMRKFVRRYEKENAPFLEILKKTSSQDAADLRKKYRRYRELVEMKDMLEKERGRIIEAGDKKAIEDEHQSLQAMRKELHEKISGYASMSTNLYEIKDEIELLERELGPQETRTWDKETDGPVTDATGAGESLMDLKKILGKDFIGLLPRIREDAQKNMVRLSAGRYEHLDMDEESHLCLSIKGRKGKIMPSMLSAGALAQLYLSLCLALFSALSSKASIPLLLDDSFLLLDSHGQRPAVELLREMSADNQIILLTGHSYTFETGGHLVQL